MDTFLARHASVVQGVLSGFDRVRFRGTQRWLANDRGLRSGLWKPPVLLKDFKDYALGLTEQIKRATELLAESAHRPVQDLPSSSPRKEDVAREIAERDGVTQGLVCVFTAAWPCQTFTVGGNRALQKLVLQAHNGKCLHPYFYLIDDELGWLNVRLQTWFPFTVNIVINGREWLSRRLIERGMGFERRENCFTALDDVEVAQHELDPQLKTPWAKTLDRLLDSIHPSRQTMFGDEQLNDLLVGGRDRVGDGRDVCLAERVSGGVPAPGATRDHDVWLWRGASLSLIGSPLLLPPLPTGDVAFGESVAVGRGQG